MTSASTGAFVIARRGKFTRKACGYMNDPRCRRAALPRFPSWLGKQGNARFAHIPTGTTTNNEFGADELNGKLVKSAVASTAIGADIKNRQAYILTTGSRCLTIGSTRAVSSTRSEMHAR